MTVNQRRARNAALARLLDSLDAKVYAQVTEAIDFARLDVIEQAPIADLERLIADGRVPPPPNPPPPRPRWWAPWCGSLARWTSDARRVSLSGRRSLA